MRIIVHDVLIDTSAMYMRVHVFANMADYDGLIWSWVMPQIKMKEAVAAAKAAIADLYDDVSPLDGLGLEEIELTTASGRELWAITLGFYKPKKVPAVGGGAVSSMLQATTKVENRDYKTIYIDALTGDFVKMEMRLVA